MNTILGRKKEMTQLFDEAGTVIPVTLIQSQDCRVVGKKTKAKDGYNAIKIGLDKRRTPSMPEAGKYKGQQVPVFVREVMTDEDAVIGSRIDVDSFQVGDKVSVTGISKGKGFAGVVKRWHFHGTGNRTHGQSNKLRHPGSIGAGTTPGRVLKGKKMAGRMGGDKITVKGVTVVMVDKELHVIALKGMVPGGRNAFIIISK